MDNIQIANIFGFVAAGLGIMMFIPQALSIWKTKNTKSLSLPTFILVLLSSSCWMVYAIILLAPPVILVNSIIIVITIYIIAMKLKYK